MGSSYAEENGTQDDCSVKCIIAEIWDAIARINTRLDKLEGANAAPETALDAVKKAVLMASPIGFSHNLLDTIARAAIAGHDEWTGNHTHVPPRDTKP